jgi:hypothetical protein
LLNSIDAAERWSRSGLDSKHATRPNLKKYIAIDGRWRFVPVLKVNRKPRPDAVLIDGEAGKMD